jgi:hypothetical protein
MRTYPLFVSTIMAIMAPQCACALELPDPLPCASCFIGTLSLSPNPQDPSTQILNDDLYFVDGNRLVWKAGKGDTTDGASIPLLFQPIIGGPWERHYLPAAVMHDHYCDDQHRVRSWRHTDRMFYEAMVANDTDAIKAKLMYYAVYVFGPHWDQLATGVPCGPNCTYIDKTKMTFQPADYALAHKPELDHMQQQIAAAEGSAAALSLDDLDALAAKNHPSNIFFMTDNTR